MLSYPLIVADLYNKFKDIYGYNIELSGYCIMFMELFKNIPSMYSASSVEIFNNYIETMKLIMTNIQHSVSSLKMTLENTHIPCSSTSSPTIQIDRPTTGTLVPLSFLEERRECIICYESFICNVLILMPCSHYFCHGCVNKFQDTKCPLCKNETDACIKFEKAGDNIKYIVISLKNLVNNNNNNSISSSSSSLSATDITPVQNARDFHEDHSENNINVTMFNFDNENQTSGSEHDFITTSSDTMENDNDDMGSSTDEDVNEEIQYYINETNRTAINGNGEYISSEELPSTSLQTNSDTTTAAAGGDIINIPKPKIRIIRIIRESRLNGGRKRRLQHVRRRLFTNKLNKERSTSTAD